MFTTAIGVPFNSAGTTTGVARAPRVLADAGIAHPHVVRMVELAEPLRGMPDRGASGLLAEPLLTEMVERVEAAVAASLRAGDRPLVVGGDCPVLLPAMAAGQQMHGRVGLVFVDGHEDAWDPRLSPTGEAADSELGLALGRYRANLPAVLEERLPRLDVAEVVVLGARDAAELAEAGQPSIADEVTVSTPDQLRQTGMAEAATAAVAAVGVQNPWWLHVDLDVLATDQLAAVDYPQSGGLTWVELTSLVRTALSVRGCLGWSLCIYNPDLDPARTEASKIIDFVRDVTAPVGGRR